MLHLDILKLVQKSKEIYHNKLNQKTMRERKNLRRELPNYSIQDTCLSTKIMRHTLKPKASVHSKEK